MRICILTHTFPRFSGDTAAPFMHGVAESIQKAGNEVFVLTPLSAKFDKSVAKKKYKVITYKYAPFESWHKLGYSETLTDDKRLKLSGYLLSPLMFICGIISLYKLVEKEKIDIVNAHWILPNGFIASVVSKLTGVPVVSTLPGSDVYMAGRNIFFREMAKFAAYTSIAVSSNSPQLFDDLARICSKDKRKQDFLKKKFVPIMYGVDPEKFKPTDNMKMRIRKELGILEADPVILGVGRLVAKKGFRYLIKAAPDVLKKFPEVVFVVVGEGDERETLEAVARKLGVMDHFRFPGWVNYKDLVHYYNLGDVFILPSIRDEEGNLDDQSVSVVEAMACGKPIVTTDFPGYGIVVEDGKNGFLIKEKRSDLIADALIKLISSKKLRTKMSKRSRYLAVNKFSWKEIGREYSDLFVYYSHGY